MILTFCKNVYCSSDFALRSYLYLFFHALVAGPASLIFGENKVRSLLLLWFLHILIFPGYLFTYLCLLLLISHLFYCEGSCVLLSENLSWSHFNYYRNCSGGCSFKKIWEATCLLCSCNAMLIQRLLLCEYQYVSL